MSDLTARWGRRTGLFTGQRDDPRARRATDLVLLTGGILGSVLVGATAQPPSEFEQAIIDLAAAVPDFMVFAWQVFSDLVVLWAVVLLVIALAHHRLTVARDLTVAVLVAVAVAVVALRILGGAWSDVIDVFGRAASPPVVPSMRVAAAAAAVITASPHLRRPFRRLGRWLVGAAALGLVLLDATTPSGAILAVLVASVGAAVVHLVFGSSAGRPSLAEVQGALAELGVSVASLEVPDRQKAGTFTVDGTDRDGAPLVVKIYGRDAWDSQLVAKSWRALWFRQSAAITLTRLQQAEHEAFVTLLAAHQGVPVPEVITAGRTRSHDALLVMRTSPGAVPMGRAGELDDEAVGQMWTVLARLHEADITHGGIDSESFTVDGRGAVEFSMIDEASVAATDDQRQTDRTQLLVTTCVLVGDDRALNVAKDELGVDGLAALVPYVQTAALGFELRRAARAAGLDADDLRARVADEAGVENPTLAKLRRVSGGTLLRAGLLTLGAYALITSLSGLDFAELWDQLKEASWEWLAFGLVLGQTPRFAQAVATRGASPRPLAFGPVVALQFAISFVNLAIPSTAARIAVNVRFFQRQGVAAAAAVSVGAIDGFAGFVVQAGILLMTVLFGFGSVELDLEPDTTGGMGRLLWLMAVVVAAAVLALAVAMAIGPLRRRIVARVSPWITQVRSTLSSVRSPAKLGQVLGGNLCSELLFALTLGVFLEAFGVSVPLATLLVINVATALLAGLMPIPGGIGVTEGALITGLVAAGVDETIAFAAVLSYRLAVFYLPPIWGAFAFRWLERNRYL